MMIRRDYESERQDGRRLCWRQKSNSLGKRRTHMSSIPSQYQLQVPATLKNQLLDFRRRVWTMKMIEAAGLAVFTVGVCLPVRLCARSTLEYAVRGCAGLRLPGDCRLHGRSVLFAPLGVATSALENLARLLSRKLPRIGDQLAGHHRTVAQRNRTSPLAHAVQSGHRASGQDAVKRRFSRGRAEFSPSACGVRSRRSASLVAFLFVRSLFPAAAAIRWHASLRRGEIRLATRSRPSNRFRKRWLFRTANHSRSSPG